MNESFLKVYRTPSLIYLHWNLQGSHLLLALAGHLYCALLLVESEIKHQVDSWHNLEEEKWKTGMTKR